MKRQSLLEHFQQIKAAEATRDRLMRNCKRSLLRAAPEPVRAMLQNYTFSWYTNMQGVPFEKWLLKLVEHGELTASFRLGSRFHDPVKRGHAKSMQELEESLEMLAELWRGKIDVTVESTLDYSLNTHPPIGTIEVRFRAM